MLVGVPPPVTPFVLPEKPQLTFLDYEEPVTAPPLATSLSFTEPRELTPQIDSRSMTPESAMAPPAPTTTTPATTSGIDANTLAMAIALAFCQTNAGEISKKGVAPPKEYSGSNDYVDFRHEVQLYLKSYESRFQDDEAKIIFVLSYLNSESASTWAENYIEGASQSGSLIINNT
ncbi:hypothetical protein ACEPAG_2106 [Sanghuangporus baumii]